MIPDSDERKRDFIQEKVDEKLHVLEKAREADMDSRQVKNLERELASLKDDLLDLNLSGKKQSKKDSKKEQVRIETAEARAEEMLARRTDDVSDFDQMGIDALLVYEADNYKHLGFATMMQRGVKGIDPSYSKRAAALYLKVQSVFEQSGGKNVVFATGTPISNTAAEIWTFMKYLMPKEVMQENDIYYFDDFVRNFGKISQSL
jgi:N12 class adenine-specific DNA methylase